MRDHSMANCNLGYCINWIQLSTGSGKCKSTVQKQTRSCGFKRFSRSVDVNRSNYWISNCAVLMTPLQHNANANSVSASMDTLSHKFEVKALQSTRPALSQTDKPVDAIILLCFFVASAYWVIECGHRDWHGWWNRRVPCIQAGFHALVRFMSYEVLT